jgi:hypothetical protein
MGFLAFCILTWFIGATIVGAFRSREERAKLVQEFREAPGQSLFMIAWLTAIYIFVIGIFAPAFGKSEFFDTGWQQVGGVGALGGWIVTWFWKFG